MLTFFDHDHRLNRRSFLQVGSLALGGLSLRQMLAQGASEAESLLADRAVIFLFLHGGPSQTETFDPKMSAPVGIRSATGEISTKIPGVTFGSSFPKLAARADQLAIVRSFMTGDGNHDIKPVVSKDSMKANLGSVYSRIAGINHPKTGIPRNVVLFPRSVDPSTQAGTMSFGKFTDTGALGTAYTPFDPSSGSMLQQDMRLSISRDRLDDRRYLLDRLDQIKWTLNEGGALEGMDRTRAQAFSTILGGVADAFDLGRESPRTIERYNTAPLVRPENIDKKWKNYNNYVDNAKSLGKLLLLARRLCERGCGFVTVTTNFVWDMHADQNNATVEQGMRYMGAPLDHAVSAFLDDVHARGLSDKILLVVTGEMGRTPKINKNGGRDHWGNITPLLLAGGGLRSGCVIGQSDKHAGTPATEPQTIPNLIATILHSVCDVGKLRIVPGMPREIAQTMTSWDPIPGLLPNS